MTGLRRVITFSDPEEAQVAVGYLRANGIEAILGDHHTLTTMPYHRIALNGFRVLAPLSQYDDAVTLLKQIKEETAQSARPDPKCPSCGSNTLQRNKQWFVSLALIIFSGLPFVKKSPAYICNHCGAHFSRDKASELGIE